jgi:hypothetical protein
MVSSAWTAPVMQEMSVMALSNSDFIWTTMFAIMSSKSADSNPATQRFQRP